MTSRRRIAGPNAKNRDVLLDAAERLMLADGYPAVTSRRVAAEAGLKYQLVHYYFRTMDDLFLAIIRRGAEQGAARQAEALASERPLRALWEMSIDPRGTALSVELHALGNHRKVVRAELAEHASRFRTQQIEALTLAFEREGLSLGVVPPAVLSVFATSLSRVLIMEQAMDMTVGHDEAMAFVEQWLDEMETGAQRRVSAGARPGA